MSAEVLQASGCLGSQLGGSSTREEWDEVGRRFYEGRELYGPALECFQNAGNEEMARKCEAFLAEQEAGDLRSQQKPKEARRAYLLAGGKESLLRQGSLFLLNLDQKMCASAGHSFIGRRHARFELRSRAKKARRG